MGSVPPMRTSDPNYPASEASKLRVSVGGTGLPEHQPIGRLGPPPIAASANSSLGSVEPLISSFGWSPYPSSLLRRPGSMNEAEAVTRRKRDTEVRHARDHTDTECTTAGNKSIASARRLTVATRRCSLERRSSPQRSKELGMRDVKARSVIVLTSHECVLRKGINGRGNPINCSGSESNDSNWATFPIQSCIFPGVSLSPLRAVVLFADWSTFGPSKRASRNPRVRNGPIPWCLRDGSCGRRFNSDWWCDWEVALFDGTNAVYTSDATYRCGTRKQTAENEWDESSMEI